MYYVRPIQKFLGLGHIVLGGRGPVIIFFLTLDTDYYYYYYLYTNRLLLIIVEYEWLDCA